MFMGKRMSINLLPWREMQDTRRTKILLYSLCVYSIFVCIAMSFCKNFFSHETLKMQSQTLLLKQHMQKITLNHPKINSALLQKLKQLHDKKLTSIKMNDVIMDLLSRIANDMPSSITLNSLLINSKKIIITGTGNQLSDIHQYHSALQKNLPWKKVLLAEMHSDSQNKSQMHFTIQVTP
jgi:Tfp pilus assembly protein PilN